MTWERYIKRITSPGFGYPSGNDRFRSGNGVGTVFFKLLRNCENKEISNIITKKALKKITLKKIDRSAAKIEKINTF